MKDTVLEYKKFDKYKKLVSEQDWIYFQVKDGQFDAAGDPSKLEEILCRFKDWVEKK